MARTRRTRLLRPRDDRLVLRENDALQILRASDLEQRGRLLRDIADSSQVDLDILSELADAPALRSPDEFEEKNRNFVHAFEVLDRNGTRAPTLPPLGPLTPIARMTVSLIVRWIVTNYKNTVRTRVRRLYESRECYAVYGSDTHRMLRRARLHAVLLESDLRGNPLGIPPILLGGALASAVISILQTSVGSAINSAVGLACAAVIFTLVLGGVAWCLLRAAAISRQRIFLATEEAVAALWYTVGNCGKPPRDQSYDLAFLAGGLLVISWIGLPLLVWALLGL